MVDTTDPFAEFDAAHARLEAIAAQARANTVRASKIADDVRTTVASARSSRGEITVTARAGGAITAIDFSDDAYELEPAVLSRIVIETIAQAQHAAATEFADRAAEQLGANSALADGLRADAEQAFPAPGFDAPRY